jgi:hypothetical protein
MRFLRDWLAQHALLSSECVVSTLCLSGRADTFRQRPDLAGDAALLPKAVIIES